MEKQRADAVVIGGGPAGYVCAIRLAQLGKKTVVVEMERFGGECLNYGCIPTKSAISISRLYSRILNFEKQGIFSRPAIDFASLNKFKKGVVDKLVNGIELLLKGNGASIVRGRATLSEKNKVNVKAGEKELEIEAENVVIATGSKPISLPNISFDGERVISSREAIYLEKVPESILIIGGGVIGMEFAFMFRNLGSSVAVVELMEQLLPGTDSECARAVQRSAERAGIELFLSSSVKELVKGNGPVSAVIKTRDGEVTRSAEKVLLSVGRAPRLDGINTELLGIKTDRKGFIVTDNRMRTSVDSIYAAGDVRGPPLLAHKAFKEGIVAAENIAGIESYADWKVIPEAIFTEPEVASAGLTEKQAIEMGYSIKKARFPFAALGRAVATDEQEGFVKVIADSNTNLLLGMQIVGPEASNLISEAALAIEMGATLDDVSLTIHPHPTLPEALMEAAESALGKPVHQLRV